MQDSTEDLLRTLAPQVLGVLSRRCGDFADADDAVQEALIEAVRVWPETGIPTHPRQWLLGVANRRLIDSWRANSARRRREDGVHRRDVGSAATGIDDSLTLLLMCCHPALTLPSQVALTLRSVGGLTTAEIARAFLVPEATIAQRISRAKSTIRTAGLQFSQPTPTELPDRVRAVAAVIYLIFTEGHTASSGNRVDRVDLSTEAIRLARLLRSRTACVPELIALRGEIDGLLALMLLSQARRAARVDDLGGLVPLSDQDRGLWDRTLIAEGVALITASLPRDVVGPYQLQAAIAAVHAEAPDSAQTDWPQILALYDLLDQIAPGPMVTINRVVAVAMVDGPDSALAQLDLVASDTARHHRAVAVRGHLLAMAGRHTEAAEHFRAAAKLTLSVPEQRYLERCAATSTAASGPQ